MGGNRTAICLVIWVLNYGTRAAFRCMTWQAGAARPRSTPHAHLPAKEIHAPLCHSECDSGASVIPFIAESLSLLRLPPPAHAFRYTDQRACAGRRDTARSTVVRVSLASSCGLLQPWATLSAGLRMLCRASRSIRQSIAPCNRTVLCRDSRPLR